MAITGTNAGETLNGTNFDDQIFGLDGNDILNGLDGNDTLNGDAGNDTLNGGNGSDILNGGANNDTLDGGDSNNTYLFGKGDGQDVLQSNYDTTLYDGTVYGKLNTLLFKPGVTPAEVTASRSGDNLIFKILGTDSFTVGRFFWVNNHLNDYNPLQQVKFADGTTWNIKTIDTKAFTGGAGNDTIVGTIEDDIITGNAGNDTLDGGDSNNTYLFGKGDGQDVLQSNYDTTLYDGTVYGKLNTLLFKPGVTAAEVTASRSGDNLIFKILGTDSFTVQNFFWVNNHLNDYNPLQQVKFADGTTWNIKTIDTKAFTGGAGIDTIVGTIEDDIITGNAGNDTLNGGDSNNTYLFGKGDGQDFLQSRYDTTPYDGTVYGKLNTLLFKPGVVVADVTVTHTGTNLVLTIGSADQFTVQDFFNNSDPRNNYNPLQKIKFADGTTWELDTIAARSVPGAAFTGTPGDDVLVGTLQADHFYGGLGEDTYFVNNTGDLVTEDSTLASEIDTVNSTVSFTLGNNIEKLTLTGAAAINGTGNALSNLLVGNKAANILNGKAGADIMIGGDGSDTYYVDNLGDIVTETNVIRSTGGTDFVYSYLAAYTLGTNIENGRILATGAANLTGNTLNNILYGGNGNNNLKGDAGIDTLVGGAGLDTLTGGSGNDFFDFNALSEMGLGATRDVITDFTRGQDKIDFSTIDTNTSLAGDQAFSLVTGFTAAGQISYSGGIIAFNTDANAATTEYEIQLTGVVPALLAVTDFVL